MPRTRDVTITGGAIAEVDWRARATGEGQWRGGSVAVPAPVGVDVGVSVDVVAVAVLVGVLACRGRVALLPRTRGTGR